MISAALALLTDLLRDKSDPAKTAHAVSILFDLQEEDDGPLPVRPEDLLAGAAGGDVEMVTGALIRAIRQLQLQTGRFGIEGRGWQEEILATFSRSSSSAAQKENLRSYLDAIGVPTHAIMEFDAMLALEQRAPEDLMAALFAVDLAQEGHPTTALEWATDWAGVHDSDSLRRYAVLTAIRVGDRASLNRWLDDPAWQGVWTRSLEQRAVLASGDLRRITRLLWSSWGTYAATTSLVMALFAGIIWFILTLNLERVPRRDLPLHLLAVLLGALSTFAVLVMGHWQDSRIGWGATGELMEDLIYFTAGVALREELAKLLAAAPLMLWLALRKAPEGTALLAAGCVGLGFAIEENLGYFGGIPDGAVVSRFLTANFLHIATTGLSGLALHRLFRHGWHRWDEALGALLLVIGIHGGYNTALTSTDFLGGRLDLFAIILLGILAWRFYGIAGSLTTPQRRVISPLAVFVIGLALLLGVTYNVFLWNLSFWDFTPMYGQALMSIAPIAFLFIHHYRDT